MRVAVVHDWLVTYGGAERVLEEILGIVPEADLFSLVEAVPPDERAFLGGRTVGTSFIQRLPFGRTRYRNYLPLMPLAIEQFDLSGYDLVISSSYAVAKGVITGPDQVHVSYVHSPMRYAWDLQHQYLRESGLDSGLKSVLVRPLLHYLRHWDAGSSNGIDAILANSDFVARRIRKAWGRDATVVHPPVDTARFAIRRSKEDFFLTASRLVPYKRIDVLVDAFREMPQRRLVVIGDGPTRAKLERSAPENVRFLGYQPHDVLLDKMQRARAFLFAAEEDFGIVPLEAQACGTPVVAFGKGGSLETVRGLDHPDPTGVLFERQASDSVVAGIEAFERHRASFDPDTIREHALAFGPERFRDEFRANLELALGRCHEPS